MKNKLFAMLGAASLFIGLTASAHAQQLYINSMEVGDGSGGYCNAGINDGVGVCTRSFRTDVSNSCTAPSGGGDVWEYSSRIEFERPRNTYPGSCLALCVQIECVVTSTPSTFGIDSLDFEIFKFGSGSNPLDPSSTPPIKTISLYNIGTCSCTTGSCGSIAIPITNSNGGKNFCASWDASYNLNGIFGKTNGQYGYRAKVTTRQTTSQGTSIDIEQTAAFPGQNQIPIQVDVTNIHLVRSSPTPVGNLTKVAAEPYNILYRLSKDATATISIYDTDNSHRGSCTSMPLVRNVISSQPRVGEGTPDGVLTNGDFWDGRNSSGTIVPAGSYLAQIDAGSNDAWGTDLAWPATIQMTLDPLQVTDVAVKPLGTSATDMANISCMLTEAATLYIDIYPPGTTFDSASGGTNVSPPGTPSQTVLRRYMTEAAARTAYTITWDGRDSSGYPVCDGDYVYAIYAEMPSAGTIGSFHWSSIKTRRTMTGTVPVVRGPVLAFVIPSSTVIGSSPTAAGLDPFYFRYTPARDTDLTMNILGMDGVSVMRHLVANEVRFANVANKELWDGKNDDGTYASSGTYLAALVTDDTFQCAAVRRSTVTVLVPLDMWRAVDLRTAPLLSASSATAYVAFQLSQPMYIDFNIYPPNTLIIPGNWPPVSAAPISPASAIPVYSVHGMRPGRMTITEPWDGRNTSGIMADDGRYPFTMVARSSGTTQVMYATDKVYGYVDISRGQIGFNSFDVYPTIPTMYNSSDTVKLPPYGVEYSVTRQSSVTVQVVTLDQPQPKLMANVITGEIRDGDMLYKDFWDGKCTNTTNCPGTGYVPEGSYNVRVMAQDLSSALASPSTVQQTIDVYPFRIYDLSITPLTTDNPAVVSYQVSEPMKMVTKIYKPGTTYTGPQDVASTQVKRIIGIRPARTQISEYWDGTDFTLSKVPDGNYVFSVYGSTATTGISSLDGSVSANTPLADDLITSNLPVTKGGTTDLCGDFSRGTYFAPNPYTGNAGWFKIPAVIDGITTLRIYNLAGDLVYNKNYGLRGIGNDVDGLGKCTTSSHTNEACWPRTNQAGRTVAPGVYFAVLRFEATEGTREVCQTVKKILIP